MSIIKPLSKETIKLINSTQVISSVYSAVKELVENSLDAKATNIEVNLVDNGLSLIQVKDNGVGISKEDAPYMALPSYTSKISDFNDLDLLETYGFRGEGLNSICQVANVTISTKTSNDDLMTCYTLDHDGNVVSSELSHGLTGTNVEIKDLFKKMPVRRSILSNKKRINQEVKAVEILLKTYAISEPKVKFMYRVNSTVNFSKPSCRDVWDAVKLVLGVQTYSKMKHISQSEPDLEARYDVFIPDKYVQNYEEVSQVGYQFLCVNNRPIKSKEIEKTINKRIAENFEMAKVGSRKFIFCLILRVKSKNLDINLEPNKDKVFFSDEKSIIKSIDLTLKKYYDLFIQDSGSDTENIECDGNHVNIIEEDENHMNTVEEDKNHMNTIEEDEKMEPTSKKRKVDSREENQKYNDHSNENVLKEKQISDKIAEKNHFFNAISGPVLSDSESDEDKLNRKEETLKNNLPEAQTTKQSDVPESPLFDLPLQTMIIEETLSQLPKVDLGEDFDWQEIINKNNHVTTSNDKPEEVINTHPPTSDLAWSKGQIPGLEGGVAVGLINEPESELFDFKKNVESVNDSEEQVSDLPLPEINEFDWKVDLKNTRKKTPSKTPGETRQRKKSLSAHIDPTQTRIPFAGDNACLSYMGPSAFSMFCTETRAKIIKENPELTPAEVALELNKQWKEISTEKRDHYRDLAKQNESLRETKSPMILPSKKSKPQVSDTEKEKNRKQLVNMLENMKVNKAEGKNKTMVMRTFVPWKMNIQLLAEKFHNPKPKNDKSVVGCLNSSLWIVNLNSNLFVFNITELHSQLNIVNCMDSQINLEYVEDVIEKWFREKNDMSIFHPLHSIKE